VGMTEVLLYGVEPTEDERSRLRERVGNMHCVPLASVYAGYVAACLLRGEVAESLDTFEARLRQYFLARKRPRRVGGQTHHLRRHRLRRVVRRQDETLRRGPDSGCNERGCRLERCRPADDRPHCGDQANAKTG
jgi:hypothetical protein